MSWAKDVKVSKKKKTGMAVLMPNRVEVKLKY